MSESVESLPLCDWEAPQFLQFAEITPTSVSVTWDHPIQGPAPGGYQVKAILTATGDVVHTRKVSALTYTITGLMMGTEYTIEVRSICAGGEVSTRLASGTVITVYVDEIINTDCPETPDSYTPVGSFYSGVLNSGNPIDTITTLSFNSIYEDQHVYYWFVRHSADSSKYSKFIIVREYSTGSINIYHFKKKNINSVWMASLDSTDYSIKITPITNSGNIICRLRFMDNKYIVRRLTGSLIVKADMVCACSVDNSGSNCINSTLFSEVTNDDIPVTEHRAKYDFGSNQSDFALRLYPNPAIGRIYIDLPLINNAIWDYRILNTFGIEMKRSSVIIDDNPIPIDIADLPIGIYFIVWNSDQTRFMAKFIKN